MGGSSSGDRAQPSLGLNREQAAAAMWLALATLRRRLARSRSAPSAVLRSAPRPVMVG